VACEYRTPIPVSAQVAAFSATTCALTGVAGSGPPGGEHSAFPPTWSS